MKLLRHPYLWIYISYVCISVVLGIWLRNGLIVFLGWNISLAFLVYVISRGFPQVKKKYPNWVWMIYLGCYVLFFPNTLYVLTDFIHFQRSHYFDVYPNLYQFDIEAWLIFAHIVVGALFAAKLGIQSILHIKDACSIQSKSLYYGLLSALFTLSSLGIFIGRFLRFNSWQFLQMLSIIRQVFSHFWFAAQFIIVFIIIHFITYFLFSFDDKRHII